MPKSKTYSIAEIFGPTIQFEGSMSGTIASFVRFSGCNKKCKFCDTDHAETKTLSGAEILVTLNSIGCKDVILTGGEPLLQVDTELLELIKNDYRIHLETNGSIELGMLKQSFYHVVCSPKQKISQTRIEEADDLKILYPAYTERFISDYKNGFKHKHLFLQAEAGKIETKNLIPIAEKFNARISHQTHKLVGLP